jgi:hypothetical protein
LHRGARKRNAALVGCVDMVSRCEEACVRRIQDMSKSARASPEAPVKVCAIVTGRRNYAARVKETLGNAKGEREGDERTARGN